MLIQFCDSISSILECKIPLIEQLQKIKFLMQHALANPDFKLACVEQIVNSIENCGSDLNQWNAPPLFYHPNLHFSIRIIYWPGFYENNPHEHNTWSVTGILHNHLIISTYTLLTNPKRLKKERIIKAKTGEIGYLIPGCIHNILNPGNDFSASLHIFNNIEPYGIKENAIWYPSPKKYDLRQGLVARALTIGTLIASSIKSKKSLILLDRIFQIAPTSIKLMAIQAMYSLNRNYGRICFEEIENFL